MRLIVQGVEIQQESLFSYLSAEKRVPENHSLRPINAIVDAVLLDLTEAFDGMYSSRCGPSIPPEQLLRALLLVLYTVRSVRMVLEQLEYNLQSCLFVGAQIDDPVRDVTVFTKNRDRLPGGRRSRVVYLGMWWSEHGVAD